MRALTLLIALAVFLPACSEDAEDPPTQGGTEQEISIDVKNVDETIVPGGSLVLEVREAGAIVPAAALVLIEGDLDGQTISASINAAYRQDNDVLLLEVTWDALSIVLGVEDAADFAGSIVVELPDLGGELVGRGQIQLASLFIRRNLEPVVDVPEIIEIFVNDQTPLAGDGVLRAGEGATEMIFEGEFIPETGAPEDITGVLPVTVGANRREWLVGWPSTTIGIRPGVFTGTVTPRNVHSAFDEILEGDTVDVEVRLLRTEIEMFDPPAASRGEIMNVVGRGFIPANPDAEQSMFFVLDGMFTTRGGTSIDFTGDKAVQLAPEAVPHHTEARLVLRTQTLDQGGRADLTGLTARPGTFQGTITPVLISGTTTVVGQSFRGSLGVAPTRQYVYVRFLPGFTDTLGDYGLRNMEPEIRARIFETLARDYEGVNIEFGPERPDDFVEYSIIEVGGPDPNGAGLFGLDNSAGKDTGNIRLNDIVGSENAASGDQGFYVFGGVFLESFRTFSPTLDSNSDIASSRFDDVFSPFMPDLGGTPVDASEYPDGERAELIDMAVHVMGSVCGNTITHEIGHSLGMSFFQEDLISQGQRFHNDFDEDGAIMDAGGNRSFEERAEIDGAPTPHFNVRNSEYLQTILPLE
jgi:hypothetical protein